MRIALIPVALLLVAAQGSNDDTPPPAGRVAAGPPRQCISFNQYMRSSIENGRILYQPGGLTWYGNTPVDCSILKNNVNVAVSTVTPTSSLCRGDAIRVFDPNTGVVTGNCVLGPFVPYKRVGK